MATLRVAYSKIITNVNLLYSILTFVRAQDICYKQVDKKIPLSYIIVIKENKLN